MFKQKFVSQIIPINGHGLPTSHVKVCNTVGHEVYQHTLNIPQPAELWFRYAGGFSDLTLRPWASVSRHLEWTCRLRLKGRTLIKNGHYATSQKTVALLHTAVNNLKTRRQTMILYWSGLNKEACLHVCCPKAEILKYTEFLFCLFFGMGVKLGLSHYGRDIGWWCSRTGH
jgi:hypothetical protein